MKSFVLSLAVLAAALLSGAAAAQPADSLARRAALAEARYLKSLFKTDAAIERLSGLVTPGVFDEEVLSELADCHFVNGDYETAAGTYQLLSLHEPDNLLYRIKQMQIAFRMKDYLASASLGRNILARDSIPAVAALAGDAYNLAGLTDSALVCYRQALALKPRNEAVVSKAANLLLTAKDYDGVLSMTGDYLAMDPDNFTVAPIRGLAYYLSAQYDSATVVFKRLEDLGADNYPLHYYLGQSYWHTNVTYEAERELLKAWALDSSDANLAVSIAAVKTEMYRPFDKQVRPMLEKAEAMIQPDSALVSRIHQQYGASYYRLEQFDQAIPHYQEAYRYNPSYIQAISTIAYCYERLKKYKEALDYYERYLKLARPGSRGYEFAKKSIDYIKGEIFMNEP
ncbi:MAG: tetratricopeptide repeat protein [Bacteroidales bacterium]|nr:tetratricopeptide repeat protein [Bacteroidales bacterium]MBQ5517155.1 tetratricopeptide repeat protein [Bacteroidales bacterium]